MPKPAVIERILHYMGREDVLPEKSDSTSWDGQIKNAQDRPYKEIHWQNDTLTRIQLQICGDS